jgi:hypothetical protein
MRRIRPTHGWLVAALVAAALAATSSGSAATPKTVKGKVGPGFTIGMTLPGQEADEAQSGNALPLRDQRPLAGSKGRTEALVCGWPARHLSRCYRR